MSVRDDTSVEDDEDEVDDGDTADVNVLELVDIELEVDHDSKLFSNLVRLEDEFILIN